ncbi:hypothetical protein CMV_006380 [Castanea mollissima]|uniref:Uncharacterized protein n=1 Tax=Castanea mollissima TaxID=60419 RepID=A0A8J4RPH6_9ROSI|nr:hypothetical protein CMV_006380 [Castanea mollissima]
MGALELALDVERCSTVMSPKALPTYLESSSNKTRPKNRGLGIFKDIASLRLFLWAMKYMASEKPIVTEARPLSQQRFSEIFSTLGVACKCCDGEKGECTSTWTGSCSKLQCLPWKLN